MIETLRKTNKNIYNTLDMEREWMSENFDKCSSGGGGGGGNKTINDKCMKIDYFNEPIFYNTFVDANRSIYFRVPVFINEYDTINGINGKTGIISYKYVSRNDMLNFLKSWINMVESKSGNIDDDDKSIHCICPSFMGILGNLAYYYDKTILEWVILVDPIIRRNMTFFGTKRSGLMYDSDISKFADGSNKNLVDWETIEHHIRMELSYFDYNKIYEGGHLEKFIPSKKEDPSFFDNVNTTMLDYEGFGSSDLDDNTMHRKSIIYKTIYENNKEHSNSLNMIISPIDVYDIRLKEKKINDFYSTKKDVVSDISDDDDNRHVLLYHVNQQAFDSHYNEDNKPLPTKIIVIDDKTSMCFSHCNNIRNRILRTMGYEKDKN